VDADHNYFPDGDPEVYEDYTSSVDVSYPGSSNYSCNGIPKVAAAGNPLDRGMSEIAAAPDSPLSQGWEALRQRKPEEAYRIFKDIITTTKDTSWAHQALRGLAHTFTASKEPVLLDEFIALAGQPGLLQAAAQQAVVHAYRVLGDKEAALNAATELYTQYPETDFADFGRRAALYLLWELERNDEAATLRATITPEDEMDLAELAIMESLLTGKDVDASEWSIKSGSAKAGRTVQAAYKLFENYPNPFNPTTTIRYSVPELSAVTLEIYDISGRLVSELVHSDIQAGTHTLDFDGSSLASGIYVYKIKANSLESPKEFSKVGRMVLLK
jgi:hypothetical protein